MVLLSVAVILKSVVGLIIDFSAQQTKFVLEGHINQTILPVTEETLKIKKCDKLPIRFEGMNFKDYQLLVCDVKVTSVDKLTNEDIFKNGFLYKPSFLEFLEAKGVDGSVVKVDFRLQRDSAI